MNKLKPKYLVRNSNAGYLLEVFLISAVVSVLSIRVFLHITGFPQLNGGNLHIAHMLWGGILMLAAIVILLTFLNREAKTVSAIIGGVGFGAFIDEIGKFVTRDNNYFFEPAIAIIYVIFILLFFAFRAIEKYMHLNKREYAANALEMVKEIVLHDLDKEEKRIALGFIRKSDKDDAIVKTIKNTVKEFKAIPVTETFLIKVRKSLRESYKKITKNPKFAQATVWFFVIYSVATFVPAAYDLLSDKNFAQWGLFLSSTLAVFYVLIGTYLLLEKRRLAAYEMFKLAVLVSLFLTQFFLFFQKQFFAVAGLTANLIILNALQYLINQELLQKSSLSG